MLAKYTIAGLAGTALLASRAFAQQPSTSTDSTKASVGGVRYVVYARHRSQGNWRASKVVGLSVYNDRMRASVRSTIS